MTRGVVPVSKQTAMTVSGALVGALVTWAMYTTPATAPWQAGGEDVVFLSGGCSLSPVALQLAAEQEDIDYVPVFVDRGDPAMEAFACHLVRYRRPRALAWWTKLFSEQDVCDRLRHQLLARYEEEWMSKAVRGGVPKWVRGGEVVAIGTSRSALDLAGIRATTVPTTYLAWSH